mmetsp:Transcript_4065/g.12969  ORF Transcript_4065/g.12969 Transcript_4065/m.12969 type:complete len:216 (-) Transcript_4065:949-1596(-)
MQDMAATHTSTRAGMLSQSFGRNLLPGRRRTSLIGVVGSTTDSASVTGGVHLLTESIAPPTDIVGNMRSFASARPSSHWSHSLTIYLSSTCKLLSWYVLASRLERAPSPKSSFTRFKSSTPPHPIGYPRLPGAPLSNAPNSAIPSSLYIWRDHDQRLGAYCALQLSHDHAASLRLYRPLLRSGMGSRARSSGGIRSCFWISFPAAPPRCSIPYCY